MHESDGFLRQQIEARVRPWQRFRGTLPPLNYPRDHSIEDVKALVLPGVPKAVIEPGPDGTTVAGMLDQARHVTDWIRFRRYEQVDRYLAAAVRGDPPSSLFAWVSRIAERNFVAARLSLAGALGALGGTLTQGTDGHHEVWYIGVALVCAGGAVLVYEPLAAVRRYLQLRRLWRLWPEESHRRTLSRAARAWFAHAAKTGRPDDLGFDRLLAAAYFADVADAWDRRLWRPVNWFRRWREAYPVVIIGLLPSTPDGPTRTLIEVGGRVNRRSALLLVPDQIPVPLVATTSRPAVRRPRNPWWRRSAVLCATLSLATVGVVRVLDRPDPCAGLASHVTPAANGERIGYQLCGTPFGPLGMTSWESLIYQENRKAAGLGRPMLTFLLITSLTRLDRAASVVPETEGLAGAYAAQREINDRKEGPAVRLAIVNAGDGGFQAAAVMTSVTEFSRRPENRVAGAVTTVDSTSIAQKALQILDAAGIVQVSPTMTADRFGADISRFFQMTSPNSRQAAEVARYAATLHPAMMFHVAPSDTRKAGDGQAYQDLYVSTLRRGTMAQQTTFARGHTVVKDVVWNSAADVLTPVCSTPKKPTVVYFGGRYTSFAEFIRDLSGTCYAIGMPTVIANDSVSRFLMDPALAGGVQHGTAVVIATRGPLLSCALLNGRASEGVPWRRDFTDAIQLYLQRCLTSAPTTGSNALAGGWTAGSYDAVHLLDRGAEADQPARTGTSRPPTAQEMTALHDRMFGFLTGNQTTNQGVASQIRFRNRVASRAVWLYTVSDLRTAFKDGRSPALNSAVAVSCAGDSWDATTAVAGPNDKTDEVKCRRDR